MIVSHVHKSLIILVDFILLLLFLALIQTAAVGPVLSVHQHLHPKLSSQQFFSIILHFLPDGFNLCLRRKKKMQKSIPNSK